MNRDDSRSHPTCTAPCTPTAAAASRASAMPTFSSSKGKSRCVWLSMTGTGSGSGAGGYPCLPVPSLPGARNGTGVRELCISPSLSGRPGPHEPGAPGELTRPRHFPRQCAFPNRSLRRRQIFPGTLCQVRQLC